MAFAVLVNQRIREMKNSLLPLPRSLNGHWKCRSCCIPEVRSEQGGFSEVLLTLLSILSLPEQGCSLARDEMQEPEASS